MKYQSRCIVALVGILMLAGCGGNIKDWAEETFYQSNAYKDDLKVVKRYLRGMRLYDQFTTLGIFDALWLSDEVRTFYAQITSRAAGKNEEASLAFLRRQLSANSLFVSFYVLSLDTISLINAPLLWTIYLDIDGKKYIPVEVKNVDLPFEYIDFFGNRINSHKQAYEIKFDKKDADRDILEGAKTLKLFFSTARHYDFMEWNLDPEGKVELPLKKIKEKALVEKKNRRKGRNQRPDPQQEYTVDDVHFATI